MNKTWNTNVIGVLASDESVQHALGRKAFIKNTQNVMQFYVRMISKVPDSFPPHIKLVTFFGSDLEKWGFEGNDLGVTEGKRAVNQFLADNLLVFKPHRKVLYEGPEVYDGKELTLIPKSEGYHEGVHLTPFPIFSEEEHGITQEDFEARLQTQRSVGKIEGFSTEPKDSPSYIIWKNNEFDYKVYGPFSGHSYGDEGFTFTTNRQIKSASFSEEWLDDCYEYENTMYVPYEIYTYMDGTIAAAEPLYFEQRKAPIMEELQRQKLATLKQQVNSGEVGSLEEELMEQFRNTTRVQGLLYDEKDLYNFHTAMKSSNLVILAGMSGTGKSKLVKAYAEALGLEEDYQFALIPVRPAWTDDADVIGYADTHNHLYRPGDSDVINTLLHAKDNPSKLHIICFDEMNLARVEHYFSQFLSVLEVESGASRVLRLYNDTLREKLSNSNVYPPVIPIGDNVIFVGTVNLDESTYHFSDKVLDRANVITLNVLPFTNLKTLMIEEGQLNRNRNKTISYELLESLRNNDPDIVMNEQELGILWEIHTELQKVNKNLGVGPRIVRQMDRYLKNLPNNHHYSRKEAFDKQVVQRILTKVRGPEDQLKGFIGIYDKQTDTVVESMFADILNRYADVSAFDETKKVLKQKAKELKLNGYTL